MLRWARHVGTWVYDMEVLVFPRTLPLALIAALLAGAALVVPGSAAASDQRAYELVTNGTDNGLDFGTGLPSRDGQRVLVQSGSPVGDEPVGGLGSSASAARTDSGWTVDIVHPVTLNDTSMSAVFATEDHSRIIFTGGERLAPEDVDSAADVYQRQPDGTFALISQGTTSGPNPEAAATFAGQSGDGSHVFFLSAEELVPGVAAKTDTKPMLYERVGGVTRAVGLFSDESLLSTDGAGFAQNVYGQLNADGAISADGTKVFIQAAQPTGPSSALRTEIYLRSDGDTTTWVSKPAPGAPAATVQNKAFQFAAADGSKVFFTSTQPLTADETVSSTTLDLFEYTLATGALRRVSATPATPVLGLVRGSADGGTVYFVAGTASVPQLYVERNGTLSLIGTLALNDQGPIASGPTAGRPVDVTPDGRFLLFGTKAKLVPEDTDAAVLDFYKYDATEKTLTLVSGGNGAGVPALFTGQFNSAVARRGAISDDGAVAIFQTTEALVPEDKNTVLDVYERTADGLRLVSSGTSEYASEIVGLSADGKTAFFRTRDSLVGWDDDGGAYDVYAARIGGGFPEPQPATVVPQCDGDACQGPATPQPEQEPPPATWGTGPAEQSTSNIHSFLVMPVSSKWRTTFARTGWLSLKVRVGTAGKVSGRLRARVGGKLRTVGWATRTVAHADTVTLKLRLFRSARRQLSSDGKLPLRIEVRFSAGGRPTSMAMTLRRAK